MSLTLQLSPETEARFQTRADANGLPVVEYVSRFLEAIQPADIEGDLVYRIKNAVPADLQRRFTRLYAKRRRTPTALTPDEYTELLRLTDQIEECDAERAENLARLAKLRNVRLDAVVAQLNLKPVPHE